MTLLDTRSPNCFRHGAGATKRALDKLTPQVYRELQIKLARRCMGRERDGHTLQTTALINELYLRLSDLKLIDWCRTGRIFRTVCPTNAAYSH